MKTILLLLFTLILFSCNKPKQKTETKSAGNAVPRLELIWASDTTLRTPESVLVDDASGILYVSCINLNPWEKDGNGYIAKMDLAGNITAPKWVEGLNGPKGMGLVGNQLYVADIDELVQINTETGTITGRYVLEGTPQLNDVTVGDDGSVYVSASGTSVIYKLDGMELKPLFSGAADERFNGLYWEKDRMLLVTSGSSQFKEIPWGTMESRVIAENLGAGDAVCAVGDGNYITTSWSGTVFFISTDGTVSKLLDTTETGENTADAGFSIKNQILYIPTFYKNQVKAYKLGR